jgi:hypothetical protein
MICNVWPLYSGFVAIIIKIEGEFAEELRNKIKTSINTYKIMTGVEEYYYIIGLNK